MQIYPAVHYTMGGLWVDYNLMSSVPGCFVAGEANFSDHGANRLGASALMQGLADGYFVLPYTIGDYLADDIRTGPISTETPEFEKTANEVTENISKLMNIKGTKPVDHFHKRLGKVMWNNVGMARNAEGLNAAIDEIKIIRAEFYDDVRIPGDANELNPELEKALRVADLIDLGQLMAIDALNRSESCGGHFREESQTDDGEALRDDENFTYVSAWEYTGDPSTPNHHKEDLVYENIKLVQRSYK
jgi:succinate dehydrogenase / fumarate reductase flavoprotein subunit